MKVTDLKENEVIHCETEEQANAICKLMHEAGLKWSDGKSYLNNNEYSCYNERTCYKPYTGTFCSLNFFEEEECFTIHKAEKFLNTKTMTKTRVLFEEVEEKKLKPIKFEKALTYDLSFGKPKLKINDYDEVILISRNYTNSLDVILAKKKDNEDVLYLGHWNDGVVE